MKIKLFILAAFILICFVPLFAEMSAIRDSDDNYSSYLLIYRDSPNNEIWKKFSNDPNRVLLNENGDLNADGEPSFAINPITGSPEVVWSKFDGIDYEIAYSYFEGLEWSEYEIITYNNINDFDPCIAFNNDGTVKVAWWSDEPIQQVYYKVRKNNGEWSLTLRVSDFLETSRFPSITALNNLSYVGYESLANPGEKNICLGTIGEDPDPIPQLLTRKKVGTGNLVPNSEPMPHNENDHIWIDWIYDENFLCWSEKIDDEWTPQRYEPYSGPEDILRARLYIKIKVLDGQ